MVCGQWFLLRGSTGGLQEELSMTWKAVRSIQIAAVLSAGVFPWMLAGAQDSGADSLESQLAAKYKLVKLGTDSTGVAVLETGTVLVIKKGGIISVPTGNSVILPSTVKDGQVHASSNTVAQGVSKFMKWKGL